MKLNSQDNSMRKQMLIYSFVGLMMIVVGIVDAVLYRIDGNLELLIVSVTCLMSGLGVGLAGSIRKDLYDRMAAIENLVQRWNINDKVNRLYP